MRLEFLGNRERGQTVGGRSRFITERSQRLTKHRHGIGVVVHDERANSPMVSAWPCRTSKDFSRRRPCRRRQSDDELAAATDPVAPRLDGSPVQFHHRPHDCQSEAESALRSVDRLPTLHEQIEHHG